MVDAVAFAEIFSKQEYENSPIIVKCDFISYFR